MRGIKHVLTERWYTWEDARKAAETDQEIDLHAEGEKRAYTPPRVSDSIMDEADTQGESMSQGANIAVAQLPPGGSADAAGARPNV